MKDEILECPIFVGHPELDVHQTMHYDTIVHAPDPMWPGSNNRGPHMDYQFCRGRFSITAEEQLAAKERVRALEVNTNHPDKWKVRCALRIKQYV